MYRDSKEEGNFNVALPSVSVPVSVRVPVLVEELTRSDLYECLVTQQST
jgi:hypothetical protein